MSIFLPEGQDTPSLQQPGVAQPSNPEVSDDDLKIMQRVLSAASRYPNMIPDQFMAYLMDYVQTSGLIVPIGQIFGYEKVSTQVITDFASIPAPVDGQSVLLRVGSAPYTYVLMTYDQTNGQWVSPEFSAGGGGVQTTSDAFVDFGGFGGISWKPAHSGGLTMQLKWSGSLENEASTATAQIKLVFGNFTSSFTTATMSSQTSAGDAVTRPVGVDWTNVSDPGDYDVVAIGLQAKRNGSGTTVCSAGIVGRFVK